jgi:uncharacterized circularly permuted ATP-grasp superfamily protein/uncharacterized alpha-E superfamily protein
VSEPFPRHGSGFTQEQASLFTDAAAFGYALNRPSEPVYDEIVTGTGHLRAHWQSLLVRLTPLDSKDMAERVEEAQRLLRQNDVTYTIYGDPQSSERVWPLDIMPLLITADEWRVISAGVIQRARLLNAVLTDLYGPRRMVIDGVLPPALLEANPGFLRPCHGLMPQDGTYLHLYAVDLGRTSIGQWRVLADRTETPSGAGYALENRSVIGRVLADCMTDRHVEPLTPFFTALRDGLMAHTPDNRLQNDMPRIVLLTPGPYNETYFEHLYLANHLGITLVQGDDLTVRGGRVYVKTVNALEPVDIILRRVDDTFCDPLELFRDSALGIAGLTEAVRAGTVTVANALGSGAVQAVAFKSFFPALARKLLGEDLILPDVASWWCGDDSARAHVLGNLDAMAVRPAFAPSGISSVHLVSGAELSLPERDTLVQRIKARPLDFVGQERMALSNAPIWDNGKLEPRPVSLRVYVAAGPKGFVVMPGGLTRTSRAGGSPIVSMQSGSGSKDTWVLDDAARKPTAERLAPANIIPFSETPARRVSLGALPSRVADGLFWTGRYAERANGAVRLLRAIVSGLTDPARGWDLADAEPLLNLAAYLQLIPWVEPGEYTLSQVIVLVQKALSDPKHPHGIRAHLNQLVVAASSVRDRLPPDCWRALTNLGRPSQFTAHRPTPVQVHLRLNEFVTLGTSLAGAIDESMPRNDSWRFLEIGKRLERAIHLVSVVRGVSGVRMGKDGGALHVDERRQLQAIVALIGASILSGGQPAFGLDRRSVLEGVLANADDPRSLMYQLVNLRAHMTALPQSVMRDDASGALVARAQACIATAMEMIREGISVASGPAQPQKSAAPENKSFRAAFSSLDGVLPEVSDLLSRAYFTHAFARRA